jgi:hypothetical protein
MTTHELNLDCFSSSTISYASRRISLLALLPAQALPLLYLATGTLSGSNLAGSNQRIDVADHVNDLFSLLSQ